MFKYQGLPRISRKMPNERLTSKSVLRRQLPSRRTSVPTSMTITRDFMSKRRKRIHCKLREMNFAGFCFI
jgi:hypothetical protein